MKRVFRDYMDKFVIVFIENIFGVFAIRMSTSATSEVDIITIERASAVCKIQ